MSAGEFQPFENVPAVPASAPPRGFLARLRAAWAVLAGQPLQAAPVGLDRDGVSRQIAGLGASAGSYNDRSYARVQADFTDSLTAWRENPFARRVVGLISSYVVGGGIGVGSDDRDLAAFIEEFWNHPENHMQLRQADWCEELSRSGELFIALFKDPAEDMVYVRAVPANRIDTIDWRPGDYEVELAFHEVPPGDDLGSVEGTTWYSPLGDPEGKQGAWMLHFAVNRPVGALRGESDLATSFKWMTRYSAWLQDRVRLNAFLRKFLWIVYAPAGRMAAIKNEMKIAPEEGSVVVAEEGAERWEALAPKVNASDAAADGRALRWMIAAGTPGLSLVDFGEGADANLATAQAMQAMRRSFLVQRQQYFSYVLQTVLVRAYRLLKEKNVKLSDVKLVLPDVSPEDNASLAQAASSFASSLSMLNIVIGRSPKLQAWALRIYARFLGEVMSQELIDEIVAEAEPVGPANAGASFNQDVQQRGANTPRAV